jgi:SAM-dependent methyltransferase
MNRDEFDAFAEEYEQAHAQNIRASGEDPQYFHQYKVADTAAALAPASTVERLSILDFGCGVGNSLPWFRQHFPRSDITGLDVSAKSLSIARARFPHIGTLMRLDPDGPLPFYSESFDLVFAACVLHHIAHAEHLALLREWLRVLKPGGHAFVFEHNPYNPLTVRAVNTCPFDANAALVKASSLKRALREVGFSDVQSTYRIFFPHALRLLRPLEIHLGWLPLGAQYCVRAARI